MQIDPRRQQAAVSSQEAERAAREAAVAYARQQAAARAASCSPPARSASRSWSRPTRRSAPPRRTCRRCSAQVQQEQVQLRYFTVTAPTAGIVGDVPVRVGNQVSTADRADHDRSERDARAVCVGADRTRAARCGSGLPIRILGHDGADDLATTVVDFISPRVDDQTQSVLVKGQVRNPDGTAAVVAVRARADRLEDHGGARRAGDGGAPHQRPVLRVRRGRRRRQAGRRNSGRSRSDRLSATTIRCSTASSPATASSSRARRSSPTARRFKRRRLPQPPQPPSPRNRVRQTPSSVVRFWRACARW